MNRNGRAIGRRASRLTRVALRGNNPSRAYLSACTVWLAATAFGVVPALARSSFVVLAVATLVAAGVGIRLYRPRPCFPWVALAGALVLFLVGGAVRQHVGSYGDLSPERSLLPDFIVLPGYALVAASLITMVRSLGERRDVDMILDSMLVALASLAVAWVYLMTPALFDEPTALKVRLSLVIYPPLSVFMAALTLRMAFEAGRRVSTVQRTLVVTMLCMVAGDVAATLGDAHLAAIPKELADMPYAFAFALVGSAFLHPSMARLAEPAPHDHTAPARHRLALVVAALAVPAVVSQLRYEASASERLVFAVIVLALTATALWRMARAMHQQATLQGRLLHQATHDDLTGLPNRLMVLEQLTMILARSRAGDGRATVVYVDLDRFKAVNDTCGHAVGDLLLCAAAARLRTELGKDAVLGRIGGDEFVAVLPPGSTADDPLPALEALRASFQRPFVIGDEELYTSISAGVAVVDPDHPGEGPEDLLQNADAAMYQVKTAGGDGIAVFDAAMRDQRRDRVLLEGELRHALARCELQVYYQPIVGLGHGEGVVGFEALVRWAHRSRGLISPAVFVPIAESAGLISDIGGWVLTEAVAQLARWHREGRIPATTYISVNLSARQLRDPGLVGSVREVLDANALVPSALCLELTESVLMDDAEDAVGVLDAIRDLGVRLAIDDFGTGYSSLSYLRRLPVHDVKIDKSFVDGLASGSGSDEALVAAIVVMATALGKTTVAEGVETEAQAQRLRALGATRGQGYLFARPAAADVIPAMVANFARHARRTAELPRDATARRDRSTVAN